MNNFVVSIAACLSATFAVPASATVVVMNISGNWGAVGNRPADAFSGTITYDTDKLTYDGGSSVIYGDGSGNDGVGTYSISWGGNTYASVIKLIQFAHQGATCTGGFVGPCGYIDFQMKGAVPGYDDARLTAILDNTAPFDGHLLPDVSISPAMTKFALFSMPENLVGDRYATIANNPAFIQAGPGATLSFGGVSAVPETASWTMMILGFGLAGWAMRARPSFAKTALA